MKTDTRQEELKDAPLLRSIPKSEPFAVPDGFFERSLVAIQERITEGSSPRRWTSLLFPRLAMAFGTLALVLAFWLVRSADETSSQVAISIDPMDLPSGTWNTEMLHEELGAEVFTGSMGLPADDDVLFSYLVNEDLPLELITDEL